MWQDKGVWTKNNKQWESYQEVYVETYRREEIFQ